mmetsp:Transcript_8578/g.16221  ORF Transcript_8578/g.16221 Transcript_8578/m.16221 type:complete len:211 (+) Transcript_8578:76-708(+)
MAIHDMEQKCLVEADSSAQVMPEMQAAPRSHIKSLVTVALLATCACVTTAFLAHVPSRSAPLTRGTENVFIGLQAADYWKNWFKSGDKIKLKSWKEDDYADVKHGDDDVEEWIVTYGSSSNNIQLWKPRGKDNDEKDADKGLVAPGKFSKKCSLGACATKFKVAIKDCRKKEITLESEDNARHFLHEPADHHGITVWHTGVGNNWVVEKR